MFRMDDMEINKVACGIWRAEIDANSGMEARCMTEPVRREITNISVER